MHTVMQTWSKILDVIVPSNETHVNHFKIIICRFFVIQEKYFYLFLLHLNAVMIIGSIALLAAGVMLFPCFKHICGMFKIAR